MSYDTDKLTDLLSLKKLAERANARMSAIESSLAANVTASTDSDADYAAELVDARIDSSGAAHNSAGANIRYWQGSLTDKNEYLQAEIDDLAEIYLDVLIQTGNIYSQKVTLKGINAYLQEQINDLAEAYIEILAQIGEIQSSLRELKS
ncbi:MAG: hypothetical protein IJG55_10100 [Synergistaceae bacterium]|nr:hypothetical protein [Synergistaceae bacterium]